MNAASQGISSCHTCGKNVSSSSTCQRCGSEIHLRGTNSLQRCIAFLITAVVLYIPANLLPIMNSEQLGTPDSNTIVSGVIVLWGHGSFVIAGIIFLASVVVPIAKILSLSYLCWAVWRRRPMGKRVRSAAYKITEVIGRWSMIDVFVVAALAALVRLGSLMSIQAGPAALSFCGVVIFTMLAAHAFDPRLIWDTHPIYHDRTKR